MTTATPLSPPSVEIDGLPRLLPFKYTRTEERVFTHRSYFARPTAVFEDPPNDTAPDNEVLEYIGDSVLSLAVVTLAKQMYPGLRVGPHAKIRSLVVQNVTIARISEHYGLSKRLRANQSQLVSLQRSVYVQADLFEAYIGGLYDDYTWEYVKPWLYKVLRPYIEEAYRIIQSSYYHPRDHDKDPPDRGIKGITSPRSPLSGPADTPSPGLRPHNSLGITHSPHIGSPSPSFPKPSTPLGSASSSSSALPSSLIPEGHLSLLNQILQHARRNMDWDFIMDPSSPTTTPVWDAKGKLNNVVIAEGRGNTKKLAKNDGAKRLVIELQEGLSRARVAQTIPYLAKQLVTTHLEKVKNQRDKRVEAATEKHYYDLQDQDQDQDVPPSYPSSTQQTPTTDKRKGVDIWSGDGGQQEYPTAHDRHSIYPPPRHAFDSPRW